MGSHPSRQKKAPKRKIEVGPHVRSSSRFAEGHLCVAEPPACSPEGGIREPISGPRSWVCRRRSRQGRRLLSRAQVLPVRFQTQRERERETKGPLRRFCFTPTSSRGGRSVSGGEARPRPLTPRRSQASPAGAQHCHPRGQSFQTRRLILRRSRLERHHLIKVIERQDAVLLPEPRTIVARSGWNVERFSSSCFQNRHDGDLDPCAERSLWGTKPQGLSHSPPVIPPSPFLASLTSTDSAHSIYSLMGGAVRNWPRG